MSTLDLTRGYWQVSMGKASRHKTVFVTPSGQFQFTVMLFGLSGAPSTFQLELCDNGKSYISIMEDNLNKIISINDIILIMSLYDYLQDFVPQCSHSHSNQARSIPQVKTAIR